MPFTTARTWTTGEVVTAAMFNEQIRDNENFLWAPPRCRVYKSAAQSIADNTVTAITFDTEQYDNDGMHSTSTNTSRITPVRPGYYTFFATVVWAHSAQTGAAALYRQSFFRLNGATQLTNTIISNVTTSGVVTTELTELDLQLNGTTDYVELMVKQNTSAALNVNGGSSETYMMAKWIGG